MSLHADYAAVLGIHQSTIQNMMRLAYLAGDVPHVIQFNAEAMGLFAFSVDFFCDAPEVTVPGENPDSIMIRISAWGPMIVSTASWQDGRFVLIPEEREVKFIAELEVAHRVAIEDGNLVIGFHSDSATLLDTSFTVFSGGEYSQVVRDLLDSQLFHNLFEEAIREDLGSLESGFPSIDIAFLDPLLGSVITDDELGTDITAKSVNGAIVIGIDRYWDGFGTVGNPNMLSDLTNGRGMAVAVNPWFWTTTMEADMLEGTDDRPGVRQQVEDLGASLESFNMELHEGCLHVSGSADKGSDGSADFSFDICPVLTNQWHHWPEVLMFQVRNIDISVNRPWWVYLVQIVTGILTLGIAARIIEEFVILVRGQIHSAVLDAGEMDHVPRAQYFRPSVGAPSMKAYIESFEFHQDDLYMSVSINPNWSWRTIIGPDLVDVNDALRTAPLDYRVQLPYQVHPEDPYLRVRWTVRNLDNNNIIFSNDDFVGQNTEIVLNDFDNATKLKVSCRVYRTLGAEIIDFVNYWIRVHFKDRLDRRHPFVQWRHYVVVPKVHVESDGSHTLTGMQVNYRRSRLHRTDFPERCWMASRYSIEKLIGFKDLPLRTAIEYMDELPFPVGTIRAHRKQLCDYCFFGGPNNADPLPPFQP